MSDSRTDTFIKEQNRFVAEAGEMRNNLAKAYQQSVDILSSLVDNLLTAGIIDLMDIQMPNLDGYMATEKIRRLKDSEKSDIPIIAMTANAFEEDRKKALDIGMNGFVSKPVEMNKLLETLAGTIT